MTIGIAHRGFSGKYPENTMLAFEKALEAGCDGIEFDVHPSKDGHLVIIHDELLDRTTNGTGLVSHHTLEELRQLDASAGPHAQYGPQRIPTLREYFELVKDRDIISNIELKTSILWYDGIEEQTLALIDEYGLRDRILISTFNHESALKFQRLAPDVKVAFLEEGRLVDTPNYLRSNGISIYHPLYYVMLQEGLLDSLLSQGIQVNAWTVNDPEHMKLLMKMGVSGIITNFPDLFNEVRGQLAP